MQCFGWIGFVLFSFFILFSFEKVLDLEIVLYDVEVVLVFKKFCKVKMKV